MYMQTYAGMRAGVASVRGSLDARPQRCASDAAASHGPHAFHGSRRCICVLHTYTSITHVYAHACMHVCVCVCNMHTHTSIITCMHASCTQTRAHTHTHKHSQTVTSTLTRTHERAHITPVVHSVVESFGRLLSNVQREHMLSILELLITPFLSRIRELVGGDPGGFVQASTIAEVGA